MVSLLALLLACAEQAPPAPTPPTAPAAPTAPPPQASAPAAPAKAPTAAHAIALELGLRPLDHAQLDLVTADAPSGPPGPGPKTSFGLYLLALSWEPQFCATHSGKEECANLAGSFGANHFTIHGLWPEYNDTETAAGKGYYPAFCGGYKKCNNHSPPADCLPDPASIPADMAKYGPGYVSDNDFLANHEWPKHGSCTGLADGPYFQAAIDTLLRQGGDQGTPAAVVAAAGKSIALTDLKAAFGDPSAVMASCDASCNLIQVELCVAHDDNNVPTTLTACPQSAVTTPYDNGCSNTDGSPRCPNVTLMAPGASAPTGGGSGGSGGSSGGACTNPGQGPVCTADSQCTDAGWLRCANSGCCTTIPLSH